MNKFTIQESFSISAGAGSGKTYTLSRRYINAILGFDFFNEDNLSYFDDKDNKKAEIDEIVTITYTKAAASEMKERIFSLMKEIIDENKIKDEDIKKDLDKLDDNQKEYVKKRLQETLTQINEAKISTIHSFAFDLIKENSDFLKLDATIEIIDELEKEKRFDEAYYKIINEKQNLILDIVNYISLFKLKELAKKYLFDAKFREYFDKFSNDIEYFKTLNKLLLKHHYKKEINLINENITDINNWFEEFILNEEYETALLKYIKSQFSKEEIKKLGINGDNEYISPLNKKLSDIKKEFQIDSQKEELFNKIIKELQQLLQIIYKEYKKIISPNLDFDLVLQKFNELTQKKEIKFKYIMIDEFQDTNSLQFEIIKNLKYDNLFIVGDEKQSIYSFQGGEIEVFKEAKKILPPKSMTKNYRSDKKIIEFVNNLFKELFISEKLPIENNFSAVYEELEANSSEDGEIEVLTTFVEKDEDEKVKEAQNIALLVNEIIEGRKYPHLQKYIHKNEKTIGILYDSKADMIHLKKALNTLGIDCKINGGDNFWDSEEIKDIFAFLKVIFEDDKFYIIRVLESLGYSDEEILKLKDKKFKDIECDELHTCIQKIYMKLFNKYQNPAQAQANVEKLIEEVITLNQKYNYDKRKVLEILEDNFLNGDTQNANFKSDSSNAVELCSIHYTKGLAYPLVILTSAHKDISNQGDKVFSFDKFKDSSKENFVFGMKIDNYSPISQRLASKIKKLKHLEEKKRLLYVALTRAKHNIIISYVEGKNSKESYLNWMKEELAKYPIIKLDTQFENKELKKELEFDIYEKIEYQKEEEFYSDKAILGTCVHKIIELYHNDLNNKNIDKLIKRFNLDSKKEIIYQMIDNFKNSKVYKELKKADEIYFELPFVDIENGRIDLVYKIDNTWKIIDFKTGKQKDYTKQLEKYENILKKVGFENVTSELLYLGDEK